MLSGCNADTQLESQRLELWIYTKYNKHCAIITICLSGWLLNRRSTPIYGVAGNAAKKRDFFGNSRFFRMEFGRDL